MMIGEVFAETEVALDLLQLAKTENPRQSVG
jgi:hypothetical protein